MPNKKKRSGKKRSLIVKRHIKPSVRLDTRRVFIVAGIITVLSILFLIINALFFPLEEPVEWSSVPSQSPVQTEVPPPAAPEPSLPPVEVQNDTPPEAAHDAKDLADKPAGAQKPPVSAEPVKPVAAPPLRFDIPKACSGAKIAFVIDDAGMNVDNVRCYTGLPFPVTIAVLPKVSHTKECARLVTASGKELILHQPMQSENLYLYPGPGSIEPDMTLVQIRALVSENLDELGASVAGLNNHEGSLITEDALRIGAVMDVVKERGIYFLDSRTTQNTKGPAAAKSRGLRARERNIFIDNVVERSAMLEQIYNGIAVANRTGSAIMIGHVDKSVGVLPPLLRDLYPDLKRQGYELTTPSKL